MKDRAKKRATHKDSSDIVDLILTDHKPLKELIDVLKDTDHAISRRRKAFEKFAPLLISHAKPEEQCLYVYLKSEDDLREQGFEGDVEHGLADQMVEEASRTEDEDLWSARVKVLAELVEHHIKEEEHHLLPDFKKATSVDVRSELGEQYRELKDELEANGGTDSPHERTLDAHVY